MAKDASRVPYIAIVALVAVVAVVVLILNVRPSSEEAVAGEASFGVARLASSSFKPVLVDQGALIDFYGTPEYGETRTPQQICTDLKYKSCFAGVMAVVGTRYESMDGSCIGVQSGVTYNDFVPCSGFTNSRSPCSTLGFSTWREPSYGDTNERRYLNEVICFE